MDQDRIDGSVRHVGGQIKEVAGKVVGDAKLETEGKIESLVGRFENTMGSIRDSVREGFDAVSDLNTQDAIIETTKRYPVLALTLTAALASLTTWAIAGSHSRKTR